MMYNSKFVACVKAGGKILREIDDRVFIPFSSEYSIYLKNLESRKALVNVEIDGRSAVRGLIVSPNSHVELERFLGYNLDTGARFKFIEKTQEISNYRGDKAEDGLIRIEFRFESWAPPKLDFRPSIYYYDGPPILDYLNRMECATKSVSSPATFSIPTKRRVTLDASYSANSMEMCSSKSGITVEGSQSNQKFTQGSIGDLESRSEVIVLKLIGETTRPIQTPIFVNTKMTCPTCGRRNSSNLKFCGNCGTSLINY